MAEKIGAGIRGVGNVGGGVARELTTHAEEWGIDVLGLAVKDPTKPGREFPGHYTTSQELLDDPNIQIIVEAPGGVDSKDSAAFMMDAMSRGKSVVTPAKAPVALFARDLFNAARENDVDFQFEGAVGGGIPIINILRSRTTVDKVRSIVGIVNGTTNHILTQMRDRGMSFKDALKEAQAAGYAEADPTSDIEGTDAAYKLAILFMLGFNYLINPGDIDTRGITQITPIDLDFANNFARKRGEPAHEIKLLAIAKQRQDGMLEARVTPAIIRKDNPLASIAGALNAVNVDWELAGPQMYTGRGAGRDATASAVLEDVRRAARNLEAGPDPLPTLENEAQLEDPDKVVRPGYIRMLLKHEPLSAVRAYTVLGEAGINLKDTLQREEFAVVKSDGTYIPDIEIVEPIDQGAINRSLSGLENLDNVGEKPVFIPFEE